MSDKIKNLVFEGGGVLGIAYLGVLKYLYHNERMKDVVRIAGTSAGAIIACVTCFNLSLEEISGIAQSLDYKKVPSKSEFDKLQLLTEDEIEILEGMFGDIHCLYRLLHNYGWFSTEYFYSWIKEVIAAQFDATKKKPPYTFADFKNTQLHKDNRPFFDLYIIGTNLSMKASSVFSYETTPLMEVAEAVRISMSIPLVFEAVQRKDLDKSGGSRLNVYCDGGAINNYPLNLFDSWKYNTNPVYGANMETLGVRFLSKLDYSEIEDFIQYIGSLLHLSSYIQQEIYESNPLNKARSIVIDSGDINPLDFDIAPGDERYDYLYYQGYTAAKNFFI